MAIIYPGNRKKPTWTGELMELKEDEDIQACLFRTQYSSKSVKSY